MSDTSGIEKAIERFYPSPTNLVKDEINAFINSCKIQNPDEWEKLTISFIASNLRVDIPEGNFDEQLKILYHIKLNLMKENGSSLDKEIPGFIKENVLKMPSNRGYIWKDKKYFGKIPTENKPVVLFEPRKGKTFIHVFEATETKIFEKLKGQKEQRLLKIIKQVTITERPKPVRKPINEKEEVNKLTPESTNKFSVLDSDSETDYTSDV